MIDDHWIFTFRIDSTKVDPALLAATMSKAAHDAGAPVLSVKGDVASKEVPTPPKRTLLQRLGLVKPPLPWTVELIGLHSGHRSPGVPISFLRFRTEAAALNWCHQMNVKDKTDLVKWQPRRFEAS